MTLERCRRMLCCGVRQENGRWPRRFQALLIGPSPRFHRPPGRRPAGLLSDRHRRTRLGSSNPLDRGRLCTVASVSAWHLPSDFCLGLDISPATGQRRRSAAAATCALMTRTQQRSGWSTSMRSSVTCSGSDSTGHRACALPPTTSSSSTPGPAISSTLARHTWTTSPSTILERAGGH